MDKWTNSCRSCLKIAEPLSHSIYEDISPEQYFYCTSIEVKPYDELPKAICGDCYNLINKFIEFKTRCIESESKLHFLKDELCSDLEVKNEIGEDAWSGKSRNDTTDLGSFLKIEIVAKEDEVEELLSDIKPSSPGEKNIQCHSFVKCPGIPGTGRRRVNHDVTGTDAPNTDLQDIKDHIEVTNVRKTELRKSTVRNFQSRNFKCEQCNRKFSFKERLEGHMLTHEGKKAPIECKECNKTFTTWGGLRGHIEACHSPLSFKDVTCQICSKVCKTTNTLRVHLKTHKDRRERVCDECGKTFKSNVTFKNHLATHTNRSRNYPCAHCGKTYINKKTCASHISRRHANKSFICAYCDYAFTDKAILVRHIMIHENRHPKYVCDICSRSLTSQASLTVHRRIHTGEKPFSCRHCCKRFSGRAWLVEHERNHTGEKPFQCTVCELRFSRRSSLRRHLRVHNMWEGCKRKNNNNKSRGGP